MDAPELPALPRPWPLPSPRLATLDLARGAVADVWLRHPILGDPSGDTFVRRAGGPFVVGTAPFLWPVNGFLFEDPPTGRWYAYVGHYLAGYDLGPGKPVTHCRIYRSDDRGAHWREVGKLFDDPSFRFEGETVGANIAPDVSVVHDSGRYVLAYDWAGDRTTWQTASAPVPGADSGVGIAVADHPEGPWKRLPLPVLRTSELQRLFPGATRYRRPYATALIRRRADWLVLIDADSGPHFAWGQLAMTAPTPEGPWSTPVLVKSLETEDYLPAPVESFPAFVHGGYVYDPRTSVGANRNFQVIYRAPVESAHRPGAWKLYQHGAVWHAEPTADEGFGIWGQTFAGFVDRNGNLHALFPSRRTPGGEGAIQIASRPWKKPLRERGFVLSAHTGASATVTRVAYGAFRLDAILTRQGGAARICWGWSAPLGAQGRADGVPHPLTRTRHQALELADGRWRVVMAGDRDDAERASGELGSGGGRTVRIERAGTGTVSVRIDNRLVWSGELPQGEGPLGLWLEPHTHVTVDRFAVRGVPQPAVWTHLFSEGIAGGGVSEADIRIVESGHFRYGLGAWCSRPGERVKWNFRGRGFRLWLPRGPEYGQVQVALDGAPLGTLPLNGKEAPSAPLLERTGLRDGYHTLTVVSRAGTMPVDCLDVLHGG